MKKAYRLLSLFVLFVVSLASAQGELFIYNWTDYTNPDLITKFEAETGIKVTLDTYDSNETLLAKLKSGATGYDIIVPSHNFVPVFIQEGLLEPINAADLPGYSNIDARWQNPDWDPGSVYTIPWQWGTTSFTVNTEKYTEPVDSLKTLFEPPVELQGQLGMFTSPDEVITMAEIYLGLPSCNESAEDMKKVQELLLAQKPFVKLYSSENIYERMAAAEVFMHQQWNGSAMRARVENPAVKYIFPKEGVITWMDNLAVAKGSPNKENAIKFIEFMMLPENAGLQSNFARYANGIAGSEAFMDADLSSAPEVGIPEGVIARFTPACSAKAIELMDRVWTKVKQ
jgi:spermidine/putrescine transport system substrate-binding protein